MGIPARGMAGALLGLKVDAEEATPKKAWQTAAIFWSFMAREFN